MKCNSMMKCIMRMIHKKKSESYANRVNNIVKTAYNILMNLLKKIKKNAQINDCKSRFQIKYQFVYCVEQYEQKNKSTSLY